MHKSIKFVIHIAAAVFGSLAIIFAVASWRLSSGPVSIAFLSPYLEEAFEAEDLSYRLEFEDTILTWAGWNRSLDILITDVHAIGPDGEILASVPEISLGLSALSLLKGQIAPTSIELLRPKVHLVRNLQGRLEFTFGTEFEEPDEAVNDLVADFLAVPGTDHPLGQLKRISILAAVLSVDDRMLGLSWNAPDADLIFDLDEKGIDGELLADIEVADVALKVVAATAFDRANGRVHTNLLFGEIMPSRLAGISPQLEALDGLRLPLSGNLKFTMTREGRLTERVFFDLTGGAGSINAPEVFPVPPNITSLRIRGDANAGLNSVNLEEFSAATAGPAFSFHGQIFAVPGQEGIDGEFEFKEMPFAELGGYWPEFLLTEARTWILSNVLDGVITKFSAALDIKPGEIELVQKGMRPDALDASYEFRDATVIYFPEQPNALGVEGQGRITGTSMSLDFRDARADEMYSSSGVALITDLLQETATLTIIGTVEGPADNAISLLDRPGLEFPSKMGFKAEQFSGHVNAEVGIQLPFRSDVTLEETQFAAVAQLDDIAVTDLFEDKDVSQGTMRLTLDENSMEVIGDVLVEGMPSTVRWRENFLAQAPYQSRYDVTSILDTEAQQKLGLVLEPYARGPFDMKFSYTISNDGAQHVTAALDARQVHMEMPELFWQKPAGEEASILVLAQLREDENVEVTNFEFTSKDLRVKGRARIRPQDGELIEAELSNVLLGDNDVNVKYRRDDDDNIILEVGGKSLDLRPYIDQLLDSGQENLPPFILETNVDRLITRADQQVTDARARVVNSAERLESAFLTATLVTGSQLRLVLEPDGAKRRLTVRSDDAGSVARAFDIYNNAVGGRLTMDATLHDDEPGAPVSGEVQIEDYRVINAPTLAQLLAIASFTGIFDALVGDGIAFSSFRLPFAIKDGVVTIEDAQTAGSSIGVNASGKVNLDTDEINIRGTIVPAYSVNSILGDIPLLGDLLVGGKGEGIFAATYSVTGTTAESKVTVNPLSVLAPGFLRNLFSIFDGVEGGNGGDTEPAPPNPKSER